MNNQLKLRNYLNNCEQQKRLSEKTVKAYRIDIKQFLSFMDRHHYNLS